MSNIVALVFGAIVIAVFAYERFNQATYEGGRQLQRLIDLVSPDKLRARRVVLNAYAFYAFTLLLIYLFLCAYAEVLPLLGGPDLVSDSIGASKLPTGPVAEQASRVTGFTPANPDASVSWTQSLSGDVDPNDNRQFDLGIDASVSLAIALILVGLAPTFPILQRFEEWMRSAAHRLAGIPTRVLSDSEELRRRSLGLGNFKEYAFLPTDALLIPRGQWERLRRYAAEAARTPFVPGDLAEDLALIVATSAWILDRKLKLANPRGREQFVSVEDDLRNRVSAFFAALDERMSPPPKDGGASEDAGAHTDGDGAKPAEPRQLTWDKVAADADDLADDLSILLALYVEHGIILPDPKAPAPIKAPEKPERAATQASVRRDQNQPLRQQAAARSKLNEFLQPILSDQAYSGRHQSYSISAWLWTCGTVLLLSILWSIYPGNLETELQRGNADNPYSRALTGAFTAFTCYGVPVLVALALRDGARQTHRWHNMWWAHWTVRLPQALVLVALSWAISTLFVVGVAFWQAALDYGWTTPVRAAFEYNAPTPLRGSVLALIVIFMLDAQLLSSRERSDRPTLGSSLAWAICAAAIMAVTGGATRYLTSWAGALHQTVAKVFPDPVDLGLVVYGILHSALIGFVVVFCLAEVLGNRRRFRPPKSQPAEVP